MPTHFVGSAREVRALNAFVALARAAESVAQRLDRALRRRNFSQTQLGVLEALLHLGPMHQRELARKMLRSPANMTAAIDRLERRGLVRRVACQEDRRRTTIELTARGRRAIGAVFPRHVGEIVRAFAALSAAEQEELRRLCRKLGRAAAGLDGARPSAALGASARGAVAAARPRGGRSGPGGPADRAGRDAGAARG